MAKTDYTALDSAILAALQTRPMPFHLLQEDLRVKRAALALENQHNEQPRGPAWRMKEDWRFIDSRLQALRKSGMVRHENRTGWNFIPLNG